MFGVYEVYWIYQSPETSKITSDVPLVFAPISDPAELTRSGDEDLNRLAEYAGDEAVGFGALENGYLIAGCWFWFGRRYLSRNFWPLSSREAKLVQITTSRGHRGRGIGPALISYASLEMARRGYKRLFARVWLTHAASRSAFRKAGWRRVALVAHIYLFGTLPRMRLVIKRPRFL